VRPLHQSDLLLLDHVERKRKVLMVIGWCQSSILEIIIGIRVIHNILCEYVVVYKNNITHKTTSTREQSRKRERERER
jgi:hypothetical protein